MKKIQRWQQAHEKMLTSLRERQIKTTMSTSIRMPKIKKIVIASNAGKDTENLDHTYTASENVK